MKELFLDKWKAYLVAQTDTSSKRQASSPIRGITISRETGAGAITVGRLLMEYLEAKQPAENFRPWAVFDRELAKKVLQDHKLPETFESYLQEDVSGRITDFLEELLSVHPPSWTLVQHTKHTILRLAMKGNVILVGRGAHIITAQLPHVLHVRLVAPLEFRVRHIMDYYQLKPLHAAEFVRKSDLAKARYIKRHFGVKVQDPLQFHLTINTGLIKFPEAARLIGDTLLNIYKQHAA